MWAVVTLQLSDGRRFDLVPGDIIGRMPQAALHIDDARVSEAHAMVSLRGGDLKLLQLRGRFLVDGKPAREAVLDEGMVIEPTPGLEIAVAAVQLPSEVLALQGPSLPRQVLSGSTSLLLEPRPHLESRNLRDAAAWLWPVGEGWRLRIGNEPQRNLSFGDTFEVGGHRFEAVVEPIVRASQSDTVANDVPDQPLRLVARYDSVHVLSAGCEPVLFDGLMARIISELVAMAAPAPWELVAAEIWPEESDRAVLRRRWDVQLARIRRRLREAGMRSSLVRAGGAGLVEVFLLPHDVVEDQL